MDPRTQKQRMLAGDLYVADDPELADDARRISEWLVRYNAALALSHAERHALLTEAFGTVGAGVVVRPPFHCDYGYNIRIGEGSFLNFGCIVLDVVTVDIGRNVHIGPAGQILTADHPRDAKLRAQNLEYGRPVAIGDNVWIGGGAIVLPGITIGENAIVGAGSVVTRDVPPGATVCGNPARIK